MTANLTIRISNVSNRIECCRFCFAEYQHFLQLLRDPVNAGLGFQYIGFNTRHAAQLRGVEVGYLNTFVMSGVKCGFHFPATIIMDQT